MRGVEYTEGNVTVEYINYMSLRTDIVTMALQSAVPEHADFKSEMLVLGWNAFVRVVPNLIGISYAPDAELTTDEQLLKEWSGSVAEHIKKGEWREVWDKFTYLSLDAITLLARGYTATQRKQVGLSDPKIGSSDDDDPELVTADTVSQPNTSQS